MADSYHFYFGAAQALWDSSLDQLQSMTKEADHAAVRRAAERTLQLKARFMTPEEFTEERAAISKLAGALFADRDFTVDLALEVAGKPPGPDSTPVRSRSIGQPPARFWKVSLWVAVTAGSILLALDVLATAGVPVPTPIGVLIDRFSSDNPPYLPPQPLGDPGGHPPTLPDRVDEALAKPTSGWSAGIAKPGAGARRVATSDKHVNHAKGRYEHQARGREQNQARGKELHQASGTLRAPGSGKAVGRSMSEAGSTGRSRAALRRSRAK